MELAPLAKQRWFDADGAPLAGGKLYTYEAGTTTPKATYVDRNGTPNTNPVIMDSEGYADVWIDSGYYKFVLKDSLDNVLWTKDQLSLPSEAALASAFWRDVVYVTSADSPLTLTQSHNGKLLSVDCSSGAVTINMPEISALSLPYNIGAKLTNSTNAVTFNRAGTDTFEGATSKALNTTNASCQFIADVDKTPDQWAFLDFGVVDFSGYPAVTAVESDYVMIVDTSDSSRNKKAAASDFLRCVYRSVTTTDSVGTGDETMKLSGPSFTATIPTAVGVPGKRYKFIHAGTLGQLYTLATTSGQTIGGIASGSYILSTPGETLEIESDNANFLKISSYTRTAWSADAAIALSASSAYVFTITAASATVGATYTNSGFTYHVTTTISGATTLTCSGTGTPASSGTLTKASGTGDATITFSSRTVTGVPAKGTTTVDRMIWRRNGSNAEIVLELNTSAAGTGGTGNYIIYLPDGLTADTSQTSLITNIVAQNVGLARFSSWGDIRGVYGGTPTGNLIANAVPYSNRSFRVMGTSGANFATLDGANNLGFANAISWVGALSVPISGWQP